MHVQRLLATLALTSALLGAPSADAQNAFIAYGGYRAGSGFQQGSSVSNPDAPVDMDNSGAAAVGVEGPVDAGRQWQLLFSHQRTRLHIDASTKGATPNSMSLNLSYLHLGGLSFFEGQVGRGPYVVGGLGLTHLSPDLQGLSSRLRPSMNLGLGYQWPLGPNLAVRLELRGYATLIGSQGAFFCSGGCVVTIKGDTLTQAEAIVGLRFEF
jgi:opacity protein-like surface antigen